MQICNIKRISSSSLKLFLVHEFLISTVYVKCAYMPFSILPRLRDFDRFRIII